MHNLRHAPVLVAQITKLIQKMETAKISEVDLSRVSSKHVKAASEAWDLDHVTGTVTSEADIPKDFKISLKDKLAISWQRDDG
jgi:hypothetical protein